MRRSFAPIASVFTFGIMVMLCASAMAQSIPPNTNPGAVLQRDIFNNQLQDQSPWLNRPITDQDATGPQPDPVINFTDIQGEIEQKPQIGPLHFPDR